MPRKEGLALHCLGLAGFTTYVPQVREKRLIRGRKVATIAPLFPAYCFIWIELQWHAIKWAYGVSALILDGDRPARVPDRIIEELRGRERGGIIRLPPPPKPTAPFVTGDRLRVRSGPLTGLDGLYAGMAPRERVFVLLRMLGGERTVELAQGDVLKVGSGRSSLI